MSVWPAVHQEKGRACLVLPTPQQYQLVGLNSNRVHNQLNKINFSELNFLDCSRSSDLLFLINVKTYNFNNIFRSSNSLLCKLLSEKAFSFWGKLCSASLSLLSFVQLYNNNKNIIIMQEANHEDGLWQQAAEIIKQSSFMIVGAGAGMSADSGLPGNK